MIQDFEISHLTSAECIVLAERFWEWAGANSEAIPLTDAVAKELDRRLDAIESGTISAPESWDQIKCWLRSL